MNTINFETAKKINFIISKKGLTTNQVKSELAKIDGYVSLCYFKSLKFDFSTESIEILIAIKQFYKWVHSNDVPNKMWFTPAYFCDAINYINKKYNL